jgi:hypothetical protein
MFGQHHEPGVFRDLAGIDRVEIGGGVLPAEIRAENTPDFEIVQRLANREMIAGLLGDPAAEAPDFLHIALQHDDQEILAADPVQIIRAGVPLAKDFQIEDWPFDGPGSFIHGNRTTPCPTFPLSSGKSTSPGLSRLQGRMLKTRHWEAEWWEKRRRISPF